MKVIFSKLKDLKKNPKTKNYYDVGLFFIIILFFHFLWRLWEHKLNFNFFGVDFMTPTIHHLLNIVRFQSSWFITHVIGFETVIRGEILIYDEYYRMGVTLGCSGLKQFYQFTAIILLYYGPWRHKVWFWIMGITILHLTNLFRIISLFIISIYKLAWFDTLHDWFFRPLFYVVMFLLWVWWNEKFASKTR